MAGTECTDGNCTAICVPECTETTCGDDGCGSDCGTCTAGTECTDGSCTAICMPECTETTCGDDGCGGNCGTCTAGSECTDGNCTAICMPECTETTCGDDGCGGNCGTCTAGTECTDGNCTAICIPLCEENSCAFDGCAGVGGPCAAGMECNDGTCAPICVPDCTDKACGDDGCGGDCGACETSEICTKSQICAEPFVECWELDVCTTLCNKSNCDATCAERADDAMNATFDTFSSCRYTHCGASGDSEPQVFYDCMQEHCGDTAPECSYDWPAGDAWCPETMTCLAECKFQYYCIGVCFRDTSLAGWLAVWAFSSCTEWYFLSVYCVLDDVECTEAKCPEAHAACYAPPP